MKVLHDVHTHSSLSNCSSDPLATVENFIKREQELGMKTFGLSNHIWDESVKGASSWYKYQPIRKAKEARSALQYVPHDGLKCLFGVESEYYGMHDILGMSEEGAKNFDYILIPFSHNHMTNFVMPELPEITEMRAELLAKAKEKIDFLTEQDIESIFNKMDWQVVKKYVPEFTTDVIDFTVKNTVKNLKGLLANETFRRICRTVPTSIAHPFGYCGTPCPEQGKYLKVLDDKTIHELYAEVKKVGAYLEINVSSVYECSQDLQNNELLRYFRIGKEEGCQFTFGTDSHNVKDLGLILRAGAIADALNLKKSDIADYLQDAVEE